MTAPALRVAQIGTGFMGRAHSQAWATAAKFFDLPRSPKLSVLVGTDAARTAEAAERFGWAASSTDWRGVTLVIAKGPVPAAGKVATFVQSLPAFSKEAGEVNSI